ncbi:MAG: O-antigen ligase family protein [Bellilinea sp.]
MQKNLQFHWITLLCSLLTLVLVFLTIAVAPYYSRGNPPLLLTAVLIFLLMVALWGVKRWQPRAVDVGVLALMTALVITTITSIEPHRSWIMVVGIGGGLMVMLAAREYVRNWNTANQVLAGLLVTGLIFQVILTFEVLNWFSAWGALFPELTTPPQPFRFENGNAWAAYLIPLIFLQLSIFFTMKKVLWRWLLAAWMAWTLVLVYFCSSRGGMIGLAAAGLTFLIVERGVIWEWIRPAWQKLMRHRTVAYGLGLAALIGIAAAAWMVFQAFEAHPTHGSFGFGSRTPFWIPSWNAFVQSPLLGNGLFTEANFYMATTSIPPSGLYFHSHNLYLDILQGSGLIGAAGAGLFIVTLAAGLWRARKNTSLSGSGTNSKPGNMPLVMAALPVLVGFLAHSLFDSLYWLPMVSIPLVVMFGAALASDEQKLKIKLPAAQITAGLILLSAWGLYTMQQPYVQAVNEIEGRNWQATAAGLDAAVNRLPISPLFNREAGYSHAELANTGDLGELNKAIVNFKAAVEQDPNFAVNWLNLGALQRSAGDLAGSRVSLETATIKAERWGMAWLNLGEVCEQQGDEGCARQAYLKALEREPDWASDPYWQASPLRVSASTTAKSIADKPVLESITMDIVIRQGYSRPALGLAEQKISAGELEDAEKLLKLAPMLFARNEGEIVDLHWLEAELAAAKGDIDLAAELGLAAREEFEKNKMTDTTVAGVFVYGQDVYQLPTLGIDLVPQVTWIQYPGDWQQRMERLANWQE